MLKVTNKFLEEIQVEQLKDAELQQLIIWLGIKKGKEYHMGMDGILQYKNMVCVPWGPSLRKKILEKGRKRHLSIDTGMTKMYKDLKKSF